MVTMHLKKFVVLSLFSVSLTINAADANKDLLAQQCRELSEKILSLISSQEQKVCVDKLYSASIRIETAGDEIIIENNRLAKQELENAILSLHYAELNSCHHYIQISHSKLKVQKIRSAL